MKKLPAMIIVLGCLAQPAFGASNISTLGTLTQSEFHTLSEDLASALSYKPLSPAKPLGTTGFDMGIEGTRTSMSKSSSAWSKATGGGMLVTNLNIPKLHVAKGLPFGIDVAAVYAKVPDTNITMYGGELRYAILPGGIARPALAVRGAFTRVTGGSQLNLFTKSLDLSLSQEFAMFTPYAGFGNVWVNSNPNAGPSLQKEHLTQRKVFAGANINLVAFNLAAECDRTGPETSISIKGGFRF